MSVENVKVLPGNELLVEHFVDSVYGSPSLWSWGEGLLIKGYLGLKIESKKGFLEDRYKTRIIIGGVDNRIKEKLTYLATTKNLSFFKELSDIEKFVKEIKNGFLFKMSEAWA